MWYNASADLTLTLGADITATGELTWWEEVSGEPVNYTYDYTASQGYVCGVPGAVSTNVSISGTTLTLKAGAKLALVRATATATDVAALRARVGAERPMFNAGAACTLAGSSSNVLDLAVDPVTQRLHVMTSYGRSEFQGLVRVASEATAVGVPSAVSAADGRVLHVGGTGAKLYVPQTVISSG
ncbi:MAG: hypothetical protein GY788_23080 [bacterium]|nr:hypothetical protein [bacterium]